MTPEERQEAFEALQKDFLDDRVRWRYHTITVETHKLTDEDLNQIGYFGWEIVSVDRWLENMGRFDRSWTTIIFKQHWVVQWPDTDTVDENGET